MPHWRKLHTKTTDSLDLDDMPDDFTRLMWVLLPLKSCRDGRGIDMPQWVMSQLFPLRSDVSLEQVLSAFRWYHDRGMINRYSVEGRPYYEIVNWHKYQGKTDREAESPYPKERKEPKERKDKEVDIDVDSDASRKTYSRPTQELFKSDPPPLPPGHLAVPELLNVWGEWCQYHEDRGKPLTKSTALRQFTKFNELGPDRSIAAMEYSMTNNYTGLVEPKSSANGSHKETAAERIARMEAR